MSQTTQSGRTSRVLKLLTQHLDMSLTDYSTPESRQDLMQRAWTRTGRHLRGALDSYGKEQKHQDSRPE